MCDCSCRFIRNTKITWTFLYNHTITSTGGSITALHVHYKSTIAMDVSYKCDRNWENPPYGICARFAQCALLVAQVEICQSPDFVIYMSNNPSNCCRRRAIRRRNKP